MRQLAIVNSLANLHFRIFLATRYVTVRNTVGGSDTKMCWC